ncbi:hypothetical protein [Parasediminibacterium sp. JCM 36343]|uniref:hypothetical protein n=1 Tax=Parasediminibacterium sp. JCM 36343 TaxID=3374279 RepID=UPI00397E7EC7
MRNLKLVLPCLFFILYASSGFAQTYKKKAGKAGVSVGFGLSSLTVENSNWNKQPINYKDTLNSISSKSSFMLNLGFNYSVKISSKIEFLPTFYLSITDCGKLSYNKKDNTSEEINFEASSLCLNAPFLYKIGNKHIKPYIVAGPTFLHTLNQKEETKEKFRLFNVDILGTAGIGVEIPAKSVIIKPQITFSKGLVNLKPDNISGFYSNPIAALHRQNICLSVYFTDK